jgi:transposase
VLARRWVVERTFGWLMQNRRLARDYETTESSAEAWIYIAMIRIQLRRLA